MAHIEADRVKETTTTVGTGALTFVGPVVGFRTFASVMAAADTCFYTIVGGAEWEAGLGTLTGGTLVRTTVLSSSNAGAAVALSAGTKEVFITLPAARAVTLDNELAVHLPGIVTEPSTPSANTLALYAKPYAGRMILKIKGPSGLDVPLQAALWGNNITLWTPTSATAGVWQGTIGSGAGTFTTALPTATNTYTAQKRARYANVVTTVNQILGQRNTEAMFMRGSAVNQGGFFFFARAGMDVWTNGGRFFAGMHTSTTVIASDPSTHANGVGFCVDAADNGLISFFTRNATAVTKVSTGFSMATNKGYDVYVFCPPNGSDIKWRIVEVTTGTEASGTATLTLPVNTTMLFAGVLASNAALTVVTSIQLGVNRIYVETDY